MVGDYGDADTRSAAQLNRDPIVAQFTAALPSRVLGTQTMTMCAVCPAFIMSTVWEDWRRGIEHNIFSESYGQV